MIFFPNRTVAHPDDVYERIQKEHREPLCEERPWDFVDEALQHSFPASDPPPWTLGYVEPSAARKDWQETA